MKTIKLTIFLAFIFVACAFTVSAQCVRCEIMGTKNPIWVCESRSSGGNSCATSSGQQQCVVYGICPGEGRSCTGGRIGDITVSRGVIEAVAKESAVLGNALAFANSKGALGAENARIYALDNKTPVEIAIEVLFEGGIPTAIKLTRSDNLSSLELSITEGFDFAARRFSWTVTDWVIKQN